MFKIFHPFRLTLFTLLSVADLGLTYALIRDGEGQVYESNPIAAAWLSSYGWAGLVLFKVAIILIVAALVALVSLSRPRTGGHILTFACIMVAAVVGYSSHLRISSQLHARFLATPVASSSPGVPRLYRMVLGPGQVKMGWNPSALQTRLARE
jgi:hypothetical protein